MSSTYRLSQDQVPSQRRAPDWPSSLSPVPSLLIIAMDMKANRSLVVREAILRVQEESETKNPGDMLRDFTTRQATRTKRSST
jgi:hypothetical protein